MSCSKAETFAHAYVDGELAGIDRDEFERHLLDCPDCLNASRLQSRFKAAIRGHLPRGETPVGLEQRITSALAQHALSSKEHGWQRWWRGYPRALPAAAAAVLLLVIMVAARDRNSSPVLEQALMTYHAGLPMDVANSDCGLIGSWFQGKLGFNMQPPSLGKLTTCQGGRVVNVGHDHLGAYMVYRAPGGHRLGVMVIDANDDPIVAPRHRVVNGRDVYFRNGRGAWTAAYRDRDGLSYVVTADLDEDSLANFLTTAFEQRAD